MCFMYLLLKPQKPHTVDSIITPLFFKRREIKSGEIKVNW